MTFFTRSLESVDPQVFSIVQEEKKREQDQIELIASENIVSKAVLEATGSYLTNKYAEGYPGARYYGGCEAVDKVEVLAIERAKALFSCAYVNVQPHSGSQANQAVCLALLKPGDKILAMSLSAGGHLTHGSSVNISGKWFSPLFYGVDKETGRIDYDEVERIAIQERPKLIIAGGSAYPRFIDFARFRAIAEKTGAYLMVDMAHVAGLVAGGVFPNPLPYAHIVTTTTHKTLRGPRGGMILTNEEQLAKKINSAIFPGLQGGPLMHIIAAKAVAFKEALDPSFKEYTRCVVQNAQALCESLQERGFMITSGGTDCHLLLVDLQNKGITGKEAETLLDIAGLTCNKNAIPFDPLPPKVTSGIRLGSPAATTRGFGQKEFRLIGSYIDDLIVAYGKQDSSLEEVQQDIRRQVRALCAQFPIYP